MRIIFRFATCDGLIIRIMELKKINAIIPVFIDRNDDESND